MWFKNLTIYRWEERVVSGYDLEESLTPFLFTPPMPSEVESSGWLPDYQHQDQQTFLTLRAEKKSIPSNVINRLTKERCIEIGEQQGYPPGRRQARDIKEQVFDELIPKAFGVQTDTKVWINATAQTLMIDTASPAKSDEVMALIGLTFDPFPVAPLYTRMGAANRMSEWLLTGEAPTNFTIDRDAVLQSTSESRGQVAYRAHNLDLEDVRRHIIGYGKQVTRLALTWKDRISFELGDDMKLRKIQPLDILRENSPEDLNFEEQQAADFALMSGELTWLFYDLVDALGGLHDPS